MLVTDWQLIPLLYSSGQGHGRLKKQEKLAGYLHSFDENLTDEELKNQIK